MTRTTVSIIALAAATVLAGSAAAMLQHGYLLVPILCAALSFATAALIYRDTKKQHTDAE